MFYNHAWPVFVFPVARYAEPEYEVENEVVDGRAEGSMDGLKKRKKSKDDDKPSRRQAAAAVGAAQRAAQKKVQVA